MPTYDEFVEIMELIDQQPESEKRALYQELKREIQIAHIQDVIEALDAKQFQRVVNSLNKEQLLKLKSIILNRFD